MRYATDKRNLEPEPFYKSLRPKIVAPPPSYKPAERAANFVLVKLDPHTIEESIRILKSLPGINGIHAVYGAFDLVLIIRERKEINKHLLLNSIRETKGVLEVQTLVAAS
jgi:DNA-binding Lrp family transcriptional regulator